MDQESCTDRLPLSLDPAVVDPDSEGFDMDAVYILINLKDPDSARIWMGIGIHIKLGF